MTTQGEEETAQALAKELFGLHYAARWPIIAAALRQRAHEAREECAQTIVDHQELTREGVIELIRARVARPDAEPASDALYKFGVATEEEAKRNLIPPLPPETRHERDCAYVTSDEPAPCTCRAGLYQSPPTQGEEEMTLRNCTSIESVHKAYRAALRQRADEATRAEREACATVAQDEANECGNGTYEEETAKRIAAAIRARVTPPA